MGLILFVVSDIFFLKACKYLFAVCSPDWNIGLSHFNKISFKKFDLAG